MSKTVEKFFYVYNTVQATKEYINLTAGLFFNDKVMIIIHPNWKAKLAVNSDVVTFEGITEKDFNRFNLINHMVEARSQKTKKVSKKLSDEELMNLGLT